MKLQAMTKISSFGFFLFSGVPLLLLRSPEPEVKLVGFIMWSFSQICGALTWNYALYTTGLGSFFLGLFVLRLVLDGFDGGYRSPAAFAILFIVVSLSFFLVAYGFLITARNENLKEKIKWLLMMF